MAARKTPIPTYAEHALVAFGGTIGTGVQSDGWQCGVRVAALSRPSTQSLGDAGAYLTAIKDALMSWYTAPSVATAGSESVAMRNDFYLSYVKVNNIRADGRYLDQNTSHTWLYPTPTAGPGTPGVPPIITLAVSTTTAHARGRGHRGRIYLPFAFQTVSNTIGVYAGYPRKVKQLLALLEAQPDGGAAGGAAVRAVIASGLNATLTPITGLAQGSVIDVQRRRKEQVPETYTTLAYP